MKLTPPALLPPFASFEQIKLVTSIHKECPQTTVDSKGEMEFRYANLH